MNTSRLIVALTALAVGSLALTGCTSSSDTDASAPSPTTSSVAASPSTSPAPSATPETGTPTPTPTIDLADPSSWVVSATGIGPITLGGSAAAAAESMTAFTTTSNDGAPECPVTVYDSDAVPSIYIGTENVDSDVITSIRLGVGLVPDGATSPTTAEGIGIGSTVDELTAAYPSIAVTGEYNGTEYRGVQGDAGDWLVFSSGPSSDGAAASPVNTIALGVGPVPPTEFCG